MGSVQSQAMRENRTPRANAHTREPAREGAACVCAVLQQRCRRYKAQHDARFAARRRRMRQNQAGGGEEIPAQRAVYSRACGGVARQEMERGARCGWRVYVAASARLHVMPRSQY